MHILHFPQQTACNIKRIAATSTIKKLVDTPKICGHIVTAKMIKLKIISTHLQLQFNIFASYKFLKGNVLIKLVLRVKEPDI